ncbi:ATP-binding protein [Candidatus Margulisiibacteriota bacterium]
MLKRYYDNLDQYLKPNKVLVIYGPRNVGKTTLLKNYLSQTKYKYKLDSGDNIQTQDLLGSQDFSRILEYVEGYQLIAIDEAQMIPDVGMGLKIIVDQVPGIRIIATGSSSFDLSHQIGEPLTGRKRTLTLFPVAQQELFLKYNQYELKQRLEEFLVFGSYPEIIMAGTKKEKIALLQEILNSYLLKDILALERVKGPRVLLDLLKLLAFQAGSQVSLNELAGQLSLDVKTVGRYLDLLEKAFVIVRCGGFSRNLRDEVKSKYKYYFIDNGIRNSIISQFNKLDQRNDIGQLWENFIIMERLKKRSYQEIYGSWYFWRTYSQQEIDLVEERDGNLFGFECKWSENKKSAVPGEWIGAYPDAKFSLITPINYFKFIT